MKTYQRKKIRKLWELIKDFISDCFCLPFGRGSCPPRWWLCRPFFQKLQHRFRWSTNPSWWQNPPWRRKIFFRFRNWWWNQKVRVWRPTFNRPKSSWTTRRDSVSFFQYFYQYSPQLLCRELNPVIELVGKARVWC